LRVVKGKEIARIIWLIYVGKAQVRPYCLVSQVKEKFWGSLAAMKEEAASFSVTYQVITHSLTSLLLACLLTYLLTYLLTPWSKVLLENLTGSQLVKKFPIFYGTRMFISAFTISRHLSLSCARLIQSMPPPPTS